MLSQSKMKDLTIFDVKGDGHCYYRCIWRIIQENKDIAEALLIGNVDDEEAAILEIREYISISLKKDYTIKPMIDNLIKLYTATPDIIDSYPLLKFLDDENHCIDKACTSFADGIETTNVMASSIEHEILQRTFTDPRGIPYIGIHIIILTRFYDEDKEDLADKWLRQLSILLPKIQESRVAILINEDNIHYKYAKVFGQIIVDTNKLIAYINDKMSETSEEEEI